MPEDFEYRQEKIEDAITKLTQVSADLNKMIAVHELRLAQQEKIMDTLVEALEKRRDEVDGKLSNVYNTMRKEDGEVLEEIEKFRKETTTQFENFSKKLNDLEKFMWTYMGAFSVIAFLLAEGPKLIELFLKK